MRRVSDATSCCRSPRSCARYCNVIAHDLYTAVLAAPSCGSSVGRSSMSDGVLQGLARWRPKAVS
eukprot:174800-Lingulodinium_polyedra.AAC.1